MRTRIGEVMEFDDALIRLEDVTVRYKTGTEALSKVNLTVEKGEFLFVVGSSGSGKSTLVKSLLGEVGAQSGRILVDGSDVNQLTGRQLPRYRRKLGVVFQEFRLLEDRNVYENVAIAQRVIGARRDRIKRNVNQMLKMVGIIDKRYAYPRELSGGEKQRVAIARAMVNRPLILLADEPTGNLDPNNANEIMTLLSQMNSCGTTVLTVTHNNEVVDRMQKRVVTLRRGVVTMDERQGGYVQ